jgi:predicted outer membrane repeat protein
MMIKTRNFAILILMLTPLLFGKTLYVDQNMNDGFWQGSYANIQDALATAVSGDEIWVAQGSYTPGPNRESTFTLKEGVKLFGGFYGGESNLNDRDFRSNLTILNADIAVTGNHSDNCYHVISYSGVLTAETQVDGFIITNGNADDGNGGGGMLLQNGAAPLIKNCHFYLNQSSDGGGAVSLNNAVNFENCLFESNSALTGGAVYSVENRTETGDANFNNCTFVSNVANVGSALNFEKRESVFIDSSIFWNNTNGSGTINSLSLDTRVANSSVSNSAFDDGSITASTVFNIIYYTSSDIDGPFLNTVDYRLDNEHGIPREWGWYYVQAPLVLNIKVFLEGVF